MARVLHTSKTMNQTVCLFLADFQRATPFQGRVHKIISQTTQEFCAINSSILLLTLMIIFAINNVS